MAENYQALISENVLNSNIFVSATFSGRRRNHQVQWQKITLRPVEIKGQNLVQVMYFDGRKDIRKNYDASELIEVVDGLIDGGYSNFFVRTTEEDIQIRLTKKGKAMVHRAQNDIDTIKTNHDRVKLFILPEGRPDPFLQASGIMNQDGSIKASKRSKFVQINQFLQFVEDTGAIKNIEHRPVRVLDCGCGSAYLTFAIHHYLNHIVDMPTETIGVDLNETLLERHQATVQEMGWQDIDFVVSSILEHEPTHSPDIVLALHACDTATDEALAQAIWNNADYIFSVPCCHHHMQAQLAEKTVAPFEPLLRHNIVRERFGDLLTDSLRALILRIMGYQAQIIEFVSPEHTAKNLMIRAVRTGEIGSTQAVQEYLDLTSFWGVEPYLVTLLGDAFQAVIR